MRLLRLLATALLLALIGLFLRQNLATFQTTLPFTLDLYIREEVRWTHQVATLLAFAGALGMVLGIGLMLKPYLRLRRTRLAPREDGQATRITRPLIAKGKPLEPTSPQSEGKAAKAAATSAAPAEPVQD